MSRMRFDIRNSGDKIKYDGTVSNYYLPMNRVGEFHHAGSWLNSRVQRVYSTVHAYIEFVGAMLQVKLRETEARGKEAG